MAIWPKIFYFDPPGSQKAVKMNFREKSKNVTLLHSLILSYMQKSEKSIARFSGKTGGERETDRDGPEFKGPPDAIAKPSDQK